MTTTIAHKSDLLDETKVALSDLVAELQRENFRLKHLVAELLLRNQQLRTNS